VALLFAGLLLLVSFALDASAYSWIAQHQDPNVKSLMHRVSRIGDWPGHVILGLILLLLAFWRGNKKWTRIFLAMLIACAIAGSANRVIKVAVGRARPDVHAKVESWHGPQLSSRYNSFPSGHTAASTAFFASLALASWRIGIPLLVIPLLIAFSRMYVAAHYLSDVVAAALIATLVAVLTDAWLVQPLRNPKSEIEN
jgi:undecaprenyl-diphosphatase